MPDVSSHGVLIHYETEHWDLGALDAPLLLHTGAGGDLRMWRHAGYVEGLAPRRVILLDHRGHGRSDRPRGVAEHVIGRYVDDAARVLDAEGVERVVFLGYSDGAAVGYAFAVAHPDRTAAVIGLGAVGAVDEPMSERRTLATLVRATGMDALMREVAAGERGTVPGWFMEQMRGTDPEMFALELEAWGGWVGPWGIFAEVEAPTIIIVGELEEGEPGPAAKNAALAATRLRHGQTHVVQDVGHAGAFVRSELTLPLISQFLESLG